jgi:transcriptional repressor NF-X1
MDTQLVDAEPQRSVQLIRRLDTRVPAPLLSAVIGPAPGAGAPGLGKLATNMRGAPPPAAARPAPVGGAAPAGTGRGWTSVVARAPVAAVTAPTPAAPSSVAIPAARPAAPVPARPHVPDVPATPAEAVPDSWDDDL